MDPAKVESSDDILAAADARLNAPPDATPAPASGEAPPATPDEALPDGGEAPADGEPAPEGEPSAPDGEPAPAPPPAPVDDARQKKLERDAAALRFLLENPDQYAALQAKYGVKTPPPAAPAEPPPAAQQPAGPDILRDSNGWKYQRFEAYVQHLRAQGKTASPDAIRDQVEQDYYQERAEALNDRMNQMLADQEKQRADREAEQAKWRSQQEAQQIAKTLVPLFKQYPNAATEEGRRDVEDAMLAAVHRGERVDYEKIVKRVHDRAQKSVADWTNKKRALAAGSAAASARGGSPQGSKRSLAETMPAEPESILEYAEMRSRGKA